LFEDGLVPPAPHAVPNPHPHNARAIRQELRSLRWLAAGQVTLSPAMKIAGIISPKANNMPEWRPDGGRSMAVRAPEVATERVAVPALFATVIGESEQVAAGVATGATAQVRETLAGLIPFSIVIVTVDVAEAPGDIEPGDSVPAEMLKFGELTTTVVAGEVFVLKLLSPL
jgi:hypothetical protein